MMANGEYRYLWRTVFWNFVKSLRPRQIRGNKMGKDYLGNRYFEIPAEFSVGKRKPTRWYDPPRGGDFQEPVPAEWEAWLRMRRGEPPSEEEIATNLAIAKLKKENAAKLEAKRLAEGGSLPVVPDRGPESFPTYQDLPSGDPENKQRNK